MCPWLIWRLVYRRDCRLRRTSSVAQGIGCEYWHYHSSSSYLWLRTFLRESSHLSYLVILRAKILGVVFVSLSSPWVVFSLLFDGVGCQVWIFWRSSGLMFLWSLRHNPLGCHFPRDWLLVRIWCGQGPWFMRETSRTDMEIVLYLGLSSSTPCTNDWSALVASFAEASRQLLWLSLVLELCRQECSYGNLWSVSETHDLLYWGDDWSFGQLTPGEYPR